MPTTVTSTTLTFGGLVFMAASLTFVVVLTFWCFKRVLGAPKEPPEGLEDFHSA